MCRHYNLNIRQLIKKSLSLLLISDTNLDRLAKFDAEGEVRR